MRVRAAASGAGFVPSSAMVSASWHARGSLSAARGPRAFLPEIRMGERKWKRGEADLLSASAAAAKSHFGIQFYFQYGSGCQGWQAAILLEGGGQGDVSAALQRGDSTGLCLVPSVGNKEGQGVGRRFPVIFSERSPKQWVWFALHMWFPVSSHHTFRTS